MSDVAIEAHRLGKRYNLGQTHTGLLRHRIDRALGRLLGRRAAPPAPREAIWALRDVSFELSRGEVLGIVGRNGAGKSTLLKILSRITVPTEGRARLRGRVASLLEVGTGFHPELTGRENIFLNGTILGMRAAEVERKFDEIVAFAEIDRFIDTPVKRYSSGMYVRLAFAVAAHLEPEILLVDEVLAVGDVGFQRKCLGRMDAVARAGRTVVFVSHNMAAVTNLCRKGLLLESGCAKAHGDVHDVVRRYVSDAQQGSSVCLRDRDDREGAGSLRFTKFTMHTETRADTDILCSGEEVHLVADYESRDNQPVRNVSASFAVSDHLGQHLFMCWTRVVGADYDELPARGRLVATIPQMPLPAGNYFVNVWGEVGGTLADWVQKAASFRVVEGDFFGTGKLTPDGHGGVLIRHSWGRAA